MYLTFVYIKYKLVCKTDQFIWTNYGSAIIIHPIVLTSNVFVFIVFLNLSRPFLSVLFKRARRIETLFSQMHSQLTVKCPANLEDTRYADGAGR